MISTLLLVSLLFVLAWTVDGVASRYEHAAELGDGRCRECRRRLDERGRR